MHNDSIFKVLGVAVTVCVICSVVVSTAAVGLKSRQEANRRRDRMENILIAAGIPDEELDVDNETLEKRFNEVIETRVVDLNTNEFLDVDPKNVDSRKEAREPSQNTVLTADQDLAHIKRRANRRKIYLYRKDGKIDRIILPVHGKGLWSTMYGYLALSPDATTVESLSFYEHGETPGLGGEIQNPRWTAKWVGKKTYGKDGKPRIEVIKGSVVQSNPNAEYQVDGISGATITGRGVMNLVRYWIGDDGYGPVLAGLQEEEAAK
jgi:Na+-transporting NADH:ubiquinone oxidoreductase subunit C